MKRIMQLNINSTFGYVDVMSIKTLRPPAAAAAGESQNFPTFNNYNNHIGTFCLKA